MTITPHIKADDSIILNIRPSISRINRFVNDPNPALSITSPVPEIRVREMESMLQLQNGEIAVMGGLMQDDNRSNDNAIPGLSRVPLLGNAFKMALREYEKTELVIFLRPLIVRNPAWTAISDPTGSSFPEKAMTDPRRLHLLSTALACLVGVSFTIVHPFRPSRFPGRSRSYARKSTAVTKTG